MGGNANVLISRCCWDVQLGHVFIPRAGKRRGHTYCNYAQMGASVCLCVSGSLVVQDRAAIVLHKPVRIDRHCLCVAVSGLSPVHVAGLSAVVFGVIAGVAGVAGAGRLAVVCAVAGGSDGVVAEAVGGFVAVLAVVGTASVLCADVGIAVEKPDVAVIGTVAGSPGASVAPGQRPSKRTNRVPSNRFYLPANGIVFVRTF